MYRRRKGEKERNLWDEDPAKVRLEKSKKRTQVILGILVVCFFAVAVRLFFLMVLEHEELSLKAEQQYRKVKTFVPHRGVIWDSNMRELAVSQESKSLYAVPSQILDVDGFSRKLSSITGIPYRKLKEKILSRRDRDFIWIMRKMDEGVLKKAGSLEEEMKLQQLGVLSENKRVYPKGKVASHVVGYANIDNEGLEGIELRYEEYIKGNPKKVSFGRDARGYGLSVGLDEGLPGNDIILTIDENIQYIVENEIEKAVKEWKADAAVAIMMDPSTGGILAMANRPAYDCNFPGKAAGNERRNRAITDIYEPGSTFKAVLAAAAIEEKIISPGELVDVSSGYIKVPGGVIRDVHRNGILTFREVIKKSSNVGAVKIGTKMGKERYYEYIRKFGFGERTGIDISGETRGILRPTESWSGRSLASLSIGQEIGVTPLQLLRAYAAIANGGRLMKPYVVSKIISPTGEVLKSFVPEVEGRAISEKTARVVRDLLISVVEDGGTAEKASIYGNVVAGKTGTAQMIDAGTGRYSPNDYVSSFVGFVPAHDPSVALIVLVFKPRGARYGGVVAAPVFRNIIERTLVYLNVPVQEEERNVLLVRSSR